MSLDSIIDITISLGAAAVTRAGFGTPLVVASPGELGVGFTERIRFYGSLSEATADADLTGTLALQALTAGFAQDRAPDQIAVGRRETDVAQVTEFTVTGATDGTYTITINGEDHNFVASGSTVSLIVAGLVSAINGGGQAAVVTAADNDPIVTVTSDSAGLPFSFAASSTGDPITTNTTVANVSVATELQAISDEDDDWYGVTLANRSDTDITRAANLYIEANTKVFIGQSNSADLITTVTTDIASTMQAASLRRSGVFYYTNDAVYADAAWMATLLANDFDGEAPTAAFNTLETIASEEIGTTAQNNLNGKNANYYTTLKGVGATANGSMAAGFDMELVITADWVEARASEAVAQLFLSTANSGSRVPYSDKGFRQVGGLVLGVLKDGERIGHFNDDTSEIDLPARADVSAADEAAGILRFDFGAQYSGRVKSVIINGTVATDFESLTA